ncbi:MAG: hypothetical protein ACRYHQ_23940 [Janthinobacterium lividum]
MSGSIDAISGTSAAYNAAEPVISPIAAAESDSSSATASSADTTSEVAKADGSVTVVVTDAQGEIISSTTLQAAPAQAQTAQPVHVLSLEA